MYRTCATNAHVYSIKYSLYIWNQCLTNDEKFIYDSLYNTIVYILKMRCFLTVTIQNVPAMGKNVMWPDFPVFSRQVSKKHPSSITNYIPWIILHAKFWPRFSSFRQYTTTVSWFIRLGEVALTRHIGTEELTEWFLYTPKKGGGKGV